MDKIRIILASGNPTGLTDLECILTQAEEIEVAAIARSGLEAIQVVKKYTPDILVLEIRLPDMDAFEVIRRLQDTESTVCVVVISGYLEGEIIQSLLRKGISGFIAEDEVKEWLIPTLRAVMQDAVCLSPKVRERLSNSSWGTEFQMMQS